MGKLHNYMATLSWKGNLGKGTLDYNAYSRDHAIEIAGKATLHGSSDVAFRGDKSKVTPEDLLVSSLSACHMLWYLHLCAINGVVVTEYIDRALGEMVENPDGSGQFNRVTLHPHVTVTEFSMVEKAKTLHKNAHDMCFIARSVNFPINHTSEVISHEKA